MSGPKQIGDLLSQYADLVIDDEREAAAARAKAEAQAEAARARDAARLKIWVERWGIPVKDALWLSSLKKSAALEVVQRCGGDADEAGAPTCTLMVMSGPCGTGKTTAAAWWLAKASLAPLPAGIDTRSRRFMSASDLPLFNRFEDSRIDDLRRAERLVIDDLGAEYCDDKGWFLSLVDSLWDYRYRQCLPTVVTTNLVAADFKDRYGERIADRIRERGAFVSIKERMR